MCFTFGKKMITKRYRYRIQHACFVCRKAFKCEYHSSEQRRRAWLSRRISGSEPAKEFEEPTHKCPECGGELHLMGRAFRAPKVDDIDAWDVASILHHGGVMFHSYVGTLPTTGKEAQRFVEERRKEPPGLHLAEQIKTK